MGTDKTRYPETGKDKIRYDKDGHIQPHTTPNYPELLRSSVNTYRYLYTPSVEKNTHTHLPLLQQNRALEADGYPPDGVVAGGRKVHRRRPRHVIVVRPAQLWSGNRWWVHTCDISRKSGGAVEKRQRQQRQQRQQREIEIEREMREMRERER